MQFIPSNFLEIIYNPGQNIWNKVRKSSKTGQNNKTLISTFACSLIAIAKVELLEGRIDTRTSLHLRILHSST